MQTIQNDRRTIFGWCMYDWANSAYATTVLAGLLPAYFEEGVVAGRPVVIWGSSYSATSLWAFAVSAGALITFLIAPVLGAVADFSTAKKRFLLAFAYGGSLFTTLLFFSTEGDVLRTLVFFVIAQVGFVGGNVFYDAFLPQIATADTMDKVSGRGYAFGYIGGGLQFALALGLVAGGDRIGLSPAMAARLGLAMAGLWWAGFTIYTALLLREEQRSAPLPSRYAAWPRAGAYLAVGIGRTLATLKRVRRFRHLVLFLVAFMLYNDAIQTVIAMATIYGKNELRLSTETLMVTLLIIQLVATGGAVLFSRLAQRIGTKPAVMTSLVIWSLTVLYAYFIDTKWEYLTLGVVVGIVMGGSQALSRSYYASMIPPDASAEFYGFYTVFSKFSAIWGPLLFGVVDTWLGSARYAIVSLIVLFVAGMILLALVDETKARQARLEEAF